MVRGCWHHSDPGQSWSPIGRFVADSPHLRDKPLLFVDIDGVVSLFGFAQTSIPQRSRWHQVDGIVHLLSHEAAENLLTLTELFEPVWCTGWKDRANDHLPHVLGLGPFPHLRFGESPDHWKLAAVREHATDRPLAWIDDDLNDAVRRWAEQRTSDGTPTLLVETDPPIGLTAKLTAGLREWALALAA
jgi:hypothetical protein